MLPFRSLTCLTCGEVIGKGTKFNARKEVIRSESYLDISIHRFYVRCTACKAEIIFKTDPASADYQVEAGAIRGTDAWAVERDESRVASAAQATVEDDVVKGVEERAAAASREAAMHDAIIRIRAQNAARAAASARLLAGVVPRPGPASVEPPSTAVPHHPPTAAAAAPSAAPAAAGAKRPLPAPGSTAPAAAPAAGGATAAGAPKGGEEELDDDDLAELARMQEMARRVRGRHV